MDTHDISVIFGTWETTFRDNVDGFLEAVGAGTVKRTLASNMTLTIVFGERDGKIVTRYVTPLLSVDLSFELGVEFDHVHALDPHIKTRNLVTFEDNKLTHKYTMLHNGAEAVVVTEFNGDEMTSTSTTGSVVAVCRFRKIA